MRVNRTYVWGAVAALIVLAFLTFRAVDAVISKEWDDKQKAVQTAYRQTMMAKADRVEPFVGERPYQIVYGEDELGQRMIAWIGEGDVHAAYASEGVSADDIRAKLKQLDPTVEIFRITPGKLADDYVWEAYYKRMENDAEERYYGYYRFSDGEHIDTYHLTFHQ